MKSIKTEIMLYLKQGWEVEQIIDVVAQEHRVPNSVIWKILKGMGVINIENYVV